MAKASSKPTGVSISRKGSKFTITWTKGEKYTNQELVWSYTTEVRQNNSSSIGMYVQKPIKLNGSVKSRVLTISANGLRDVNVGVRGKASGKKWSSYGNATLSMKAAERPTLEAVWEGTTPNRTKFNWSAEDKEKAPCSKVVYQSVLVKDCPENYKIDDLFAGVEEQTIAVSGKKEDTITVDESGLTGSNARIVRMKAVGQTGESAWAYAYHVYAQPYAAKNVVANINYNPRIGYLEGSVSWEQQQNEMQHPIDTMTLQYWIGIPTANMGLPSSGDWETIDTPVDVDHDTWHGSFGRALVNDECLFMRVMTQHDNVSNSAYSDYVIALKANLATPTIDSVTPSLVSGAQLITVRLTDASQVPDSKVAVMYQNPNDNKIGVYGVTTNGQASFYVKNTDTIGKVGAYAFVGSYIDNHNNLIWGGYSVDAVMKSPEVWQGVAQSPTITVTKFDDTTATVKWNWPWRDATNVEISWSDHIDAWESTDQPNTYVVSNVNAAQWNISDLDAGKIWYFKVRLFYGDGDDLIYGTYSNMESLDLSAAPAVPVLTLSDQILTQDGETIASWTYASNDTTPQSYAQVYRWSVSDNEYVPIENLNTTTAQSLTIKASQIGEVGSKTDLVVKVWSESGHESEFSNAVTVTIATPVTCAISDHNLVSETISVDPETKTGSLITLNGGDDTNVRDVTSLQVTLEPVQDNDYDSVWTGGNGKNLLENTANTQTISGVTFTKNSDGTITANGTATAQIALIIGTMALEQVKSYRFNGMPSGSSSSTYFLNIAPSPTTGSSDSNYYQESAVNPVSDMTVTVRIYIRNGQTVSNLVFAPMIRFATETDATYEPYSNICPITGHDSVGANVKGKNLFDASSVTASNPSNWGVSYADGTLTIEHKTTYSGGTPHLVLGALPSGTYVISYTASVAVNLDLYINGTWNKILRSGNTFTTNGSDEIEITFPNSAAITITYNDIQLELGSTATDYVPYAGSTYTATLPQTVYGGNAELVGGTGKSTMAMLDDLQNRTWYKISSGNVFYMGLPNGLWSNTSSSGAKCSAYEVVDGNYQTLENGQATANMHNFSGSAYFIIRDDRYTDAASFKASLTGVQLVYSLATPTDLTITPQSITLNEGTNNVWSEQGDVTIRTVEGYEDVLALKELPLEVTVTGTGNGVMRVERAQNFDLVRPDERNFTGYEGETIVQKLRGNVSDQIIVNRNELVGRFDDTARYRIIANVSDNFGQSATDTLEFIVDWTHQAVTAQGTVQIIDGVAYITPIKPDSAWATDRVDIYRLSADRPELIYEGAEFNETIVDPYPTIGDFGGYRLVLVTANGDYICGGADEDNYPSWVGAEFDASLDTYVTIIDFGDDEVVLEGNLQVSNSFEKSFERVKYLGGTNRGYWLSGAQRSGSSSSALVTLTDMDTIKAMRRLAQYTGMCHIRTPEGSNFHADIQVEDDTSYQVAGKIMDCSLKITGIDPVDTDGVRLEDWEVE